MKQIILACLLTTSALSAIGEWTPVWQSNAKDAVYYMDYKTIRKDGNLRTMWLISDLSKRYKDGEMSRRSRYVFDCKLERYKILAMSTHSESMATGEVLFNGGEDPAGWRAIPPTTAVETILKIICAK